MISEECVVATPSELISATRNREVRKIKVSGSITDAPSVRLSPGQALWGEGDRPEVRFATGVEGLQLTTDNEVRDIRLSAAPDKRSVFNDTSVESLGYLTLAGVATTGQVQILARDQVRSGHVEVKGLDIVAADARAQADRPHGYGVYVIQGAFTLWNMQTDEGVVITANLSGLSAGRVGAPVLGSGIFVSGAGDKGGRLLISHLQTDAIYSDAKIPAGTPDQISGGVFTVHGARVDVVSNLGPVTTYGVNDMVLDNWGFVDRWVAEEKITSHGPSGIGFVNFGIVNELKVQAPTSGSARAPSTCTQVRFIWPSSIASSRTPMAPSVSRSASRLAASWFIGASKLSVVRESPWSRVSSPRSRRSD
jgi:hypothetical protein